MSLCFSSVSYLILAVAKLLPADHDLFASTPASFEDLFSSESLSRSLPNGSIAADITWNDDKLIAANRIPSKPQDSDLLLGSTKPDLSYELALPPCDGTQSSSDLSDESAHPGRQRCRGYVTWIQPVDRSVE